MYIYIYGILSTVYNNINSPSRSNAHRGAHPSKGHLISCKPFY